jgi:ABC-type branched-subunit amino acid transport system permease subunit
VLGAIVVILAALGPLIFNAYWISFILTQVFLLGIAAASLVFLSAYGGMVSLAQVGIYGIAGFAYGNMATKGGSKGLALGWDPWLAIVLAILITVGIAFVLGLVAARSAGIYFLMLTLVYSVIIYYFFGQVTDLSGFGGVQISSFPSWLGNPADHPNRLYYLALGVAAAVYLLIRLIVRTPFGLALQGIRDDPVRMSALGYNVALHRTLAFTFTGFIAALAGLLFAWQDALVAPSSIDLNATIDLLIIAVIGGLLRIEGAWVGAFAFLIINNYLQNPLGSYADRIRTVVGLVFLLVVIVSPDGLMGLWDRLRAAVAARRGGGPRTPVTEAPVSTGPPA